MDNSIYQSEMMDFIKKFPNNGNVMIPIHGRTKKYGTDAYFQCRLFALESANRELETVDTNNWEGISPGFNQIGFRDDEAIYSRFNNQVNMEPFVIERNYHGLEKQDELEIVEEFRLLNNLFFDRAKNEYVDLIKEKTVIRIEEGLVTVDRKYLKRYLSVKGMVMLVHCDSRYFTTKVDQSLPKDSNTEVMDNKIYTLSFYENCGNPFSILYAKTAINGCPIQECEYWPYTESKEYEDYAIGVDEDGNEIFCTSDPSMLSNCFEEHNESPNYLTLVFFKREVLKKYYDDPDKYSIESGLLCCGTLWSIYIDNESNEYVSAYLGDLGRNLSRKEQMHWKNYNITIDGKISELKFSLDFLSRFGSSESPIFIFQNEYKKLNQIFKEKFGYPLFLKLHNDDKYILKTLRIPFLESQAEFDQQILALVKLIIDSVNERGVELLLSSETEKLSGSISKLKALFSQYKLTDYEDKIKFLRNLQELRSSSAAHKKGKNYNKIAKIFQIGEISKIEVFEKIINNAIDLLIYIKNNLDKINS
ncbi:hypothetical protein [Veillonella sp. CHU732]|uniref:hypothetical protein n=1 Tax=Veillonella sp. CHU732 TaxID=2490949 RepID=UPI000F8EC094|nr:hypothetical protein [Veillonella sp. CHU732]